MDVKWRWWEFREYIKPNEICQDKMEELGAYLDTRDYDVES